ncbi:MAG: hypothetical protein Q4G03_08205 [Planctomycetia bacterium]|nr:hypothetical protein [Planctomycetia bacterium]
MKQHIALSLVLALLTLATVGCGGEKKPSDLPKLYPTTITVTYDDGTPVDGANVALMSAQKTSGRTWNLAGVTDASGVIILMTDGKWNGAPAGEYNAMVIKEVAEDASEDGTPGPTTVYVDRKFNNPKTSGLTVTVTEGKNEVTLKVGDKIEELVKGVM